MRRTLTLIAVCLAFTIAGPACESDAPEPVSDRTPGISLPRVGTIGDYPPADQTTIVNVDAEGVMTVGGEVTNLEALKAHLLDRAERERDSRERRYASRWNVVLRLDRSLPWEVGCLIRAACCYPDVRITRIHVAVLPENGAEEGTLATHIPSHVVRYFRRDFGPDPDDEPTSIEVRLSSAGSGFDAAALYAWAKVRIDKDPTLLCDLRVDPLVPVGTLVGVVDVLHRAGVRDVFPCDLDQQSVEGKNLIAALVREAGTGKVNPTVTIFGHEIAPGSEKNVALPPGTRVRGGMAGTFRDREPWWLEVPCRHRDNEDAWRRPERGDPETDRGGPEAQAAVVLGLDWLARHQDPEGFWDCDGFEAQCETGKCGGPGSASRDPGVTGLALLAFLGAGETHRKGRYRKTLRNGLKYLKAIQDPEGCFGPRTTDRYIYNHGAAALAMAEAYALTGSPLFKQSAQSAIDFVIKCQNPYLAWRYGVRPRDNDTSVTGWMVMALKSAKEAGKLRVPEAGFTGAKAWLDKVTEPESGRVGYDERGNGPERSVDIVDRFPEDRSESLTAIGIVSRIFMGEDPGTSGVIQKGAALCLNCPPRWDEADGSIDMYYWYFGSMAMFQVGGESWNAWNAAMKTAIIPHQRKDGDQRGSWDPVGPWGREGGRVYSTALMTMCLEVYYRYGRVHPEGE